MKELSSKCVIAGTSLAVAMGLPCISIICWAFAVFFVNVVKSVDRDQYIRNYHLHHLKFIFLCRLSQFMLSAMHEIQPAWLEGLCCL